VEGGKTLRDHRKLRAFELADTLALAVYRQTQSCPKSEIFGLTAQMRRAALSIPSNIAEGCARYSQADYLRFLDVAYGSTRELEYQISIAARLGFLNQEDSANLNSLCEETGKVLHGLIRSMRS
jgi:four helix bundle protein